MVSNSSYVEFLTIQSKGPAKITTFTLRESKITLGLGALNPMVICRIIPDTHEKFFILEDAVTVRT